MRWAWKRLALASWKLSTTTRRPRLISWIGKSRGLIRFFFYLMLWSTWQLKGVRHSSQARLDYVQRILVFFLHLTEGCCNSDVKHLVYASSSSVYGNNPKQPLSPRYRVDHPISLHPACKRSNELMAHSYSHLFELACTGLRYFTVYGPWGRPDMASVLFAKAILAG